MVGDRIELVIEGLVWDFGPRGNASHLAAHDVLPDDVEAVRRNRYLIFENLPGHRGTHVMIGRDARPRSLYISLEATNEPGVWSPVTGWRSRLAHAILQREGYI